MEQCNYIGVAIGASAGGLEALKALFKNIPPNTGAVYFVITHLYPSIPSRLAEILSAVTAMPVKGVESAVKVKPNTVYVLKEARMMYLAGETLETRPRVPGDSPNRAVDIFFSSLAVSFGARAIGIILSGTGRDGVAGVQAIAKAGGTSLVQLPASTEFDGMPVNAIRADHPVAIESPGQLAKVLTELLKRF